MREIGGKEKGRGTLNERGTFLADFDEVLLPFILYTCIIIIKNR